MAPGQDVAQVVLVLLDAGEPDARGQDVGGNADLPPVVVVRHRGQAERGRGVPGGKRQAVARIRPRALDRVLQDARVGAVHDHRLREVVRGRAEAALGGEAAGHEHRADHRHDRGPSREAPVVPQVLQAPWRALFAWESNAEAVVVAATPTAKGSRFWPEKTPTKLRPRFFGNAPIVRRPSPLGVSKRGRASNAFGAGGPCRSRLLGPARGGPSRSRPPPPPPTPSPGASSPGPSCRPPRAGSKVRRICHDRSSTPCQTTPRIVRSCEPGSSGGRIGPSRLRGPGGD